MPPSTTTSSARKRPRSSSEESDEVVPCTPTKPKDKGVREPRRCYAGFKFKHYNHRWADDRYTPGGYIEGEDLAARHELILKTLRHSSNRCVAYMCPAALAEYLFDPMSMWADCKRKFLDDWKAVDGREPAVEYTSLPQNAESIWFRPGVQLTLGFQLPWGRTRSFRSDRMLKFAPALVTWMKPAEPYTAGCRWSPSVARHVKTVNA